MFKFTIYYSYANIKYVSVYKNYGKYPVYQTELL